MSIALKGPWSQEEVDQYLHETRIPTPQATLSGLLPGIPL